LPASKIESSLYNQVKSQSFSFDSSLKLVAEKPTGGTFSLKSLYFKLGGSFNWSPNIQGLTLRFGGAKLEIGVYKKTESISYSFNATLSGCITLANLKATAVAAFSKRGAGGHRIGLTLFISGYRGISAFNLAQAFSEVTTIEATDKIVQNLQLPDDLDIVRKRLSLDTFQLKADLELQCQPPEAKLELSRLAIYAGSDDLSWKLPIAQSFTVNSIGVSMDFLQRRYQISGGLTIGEAFFHTRLTFGNGSLTLYAEVAPNSRCTLSEMSGLNVLDPWRVEQSRDDYLSQYAKKHAAGDDSPVSFIDAIHNSSASGSTGRNFFLLDVGPSGIPSTNPKDIKSIKFGISLDSTWTILPSLIELNNLSVLFEVKKAQQSGRTIRGYIAGEFRLQQMPKTTLYAIVEGSKSGSSTDFWMGFSVKFGEAKITSILSDPAFGSCLTSDTVPTFDGVPEDVHTELKSGKLEEGNEPCLDGSLYAHFVGDSGSRKMDGVKFRARLTAGFTLFESKALVDAAVELEAKNPTIPEEREFCATLCGHLYSQEWRISLAAQLRPCSSKKSKGNHIDFLVTASKRDPSTDTKATPETLFGTEVLGPKQGARLCSETADFSITQNNVPCMLIVLLSCL
jgi:hypothetical protein